MTRALDEIDDFGEWVKAVRTLYPDADSIEVPQRFVCVSNAEPDDPTLMDDLDAAAYLKSLP